MSREILVESPEELDRVAGDLLDAWPGRRIFAFYGTMGAGKTTFIKALCRRLGSVDKPSSPTFAIVNEYRTRDGEALYHFDFYRIRKPEEAMDIGYEDYFYGGGYCFIEWPELISELLPENTVEVKIEETGKESTRRILF